jgi:nucleoside-diphosphate-sugar epimerase
MLQHVLVTGGTGLVGRPLVQSLVAGGYRVTVLSRRPSVDVHETLRFVHADLSDGNGLFLNEIAQADAVVHGAAFVRDAGDSESLSALAETNVRGTDLLFRWCAEHGVNRVVLIGSLSVLRRPLCLPITESHPVGPSTAYAMSKLWNEEQLFRRSREAAFTPIVLRVSSPVPGSLESLPSTVVRTWIEKALRGGPLSVFGSGGRTQDFVSCSDIAQAVLLSLKSSRARGVYHIGSGTPLSMRDLAQTIAGFHNSPIVSEGVDPNEDERWDLCLARARIELNYVPRQTGQEAIVSLLRTVV